MLEKDLSILKLPPDPKKARIVNAFVLPKNDGCVMLPPEHAAMSIPWDSYLLGCPFALLPRFGKNGISTPIHTMKVHYFIDSSLHWRYKR
jgi:hypothetical protein